MSVIYLWNEENYRYEKWVVRKDGIDISEVKNDD